MNIYFSFLRILDNSRKAQSKHIKNAAEVEMKSLLSTLATRLDTWNGARQMQQFRNGWAGNTSAEIHFHRSPKVQYRYRMAGSGPTIVFSADPPMTLEVYDELMAVFSPHFRVIIVELPAMGFSAAQPDYSFEFRETSDDLAHFLQAVAGEQAILAFSCVAGLAAVDIAVRYPHLVSHLTLLQTGDVEAFARWKAGRDPKGILARPVIGQWVMKKLAPKRMPAWYRLSLGKTQMQEHFCGCAENSFAHGAMWSLASAYQITMDPSLKLEQPAQPMLAMWGLADRSHPTENAESPRRLSHNLRYVSFQELGHTPELEDPVQVFNAIRDFLQTGAKL
jgi:pimeloyl-ACP methyl ester carboxylesterase